MSHLDMVGDGPLATRCREIVARHGLQARVTLHGALGQDQVAALMRRASVFLQHSVTASDGDIKGFPTVIAEAMSVGIPVVATRHSGIPEHVRDGQTGFIVDERDVAGMSAAIGRLLADSALARGLGDAARAYAEKNLENGQLCQQVRRVMGLTDGPEDYQGLTGHAKPAGCQEAFCI